MIKVSFLMTVYNAKDYLREVILSILNQSHKNLELIIVNDGSTDESNKIINEFMEVDKRIKFIDRKINKGRVYSLNEGLEHCTTDFIFINDSDDISTLDRVEKILSYYNSLKNKNKVGLIGASGITTFTQDNNKIKCDFKKGFILGKNNGKVFKHKLYCANPFIHSSIMYKKKALDKIGGFPKNVKCAIDYFAIVKISKFFDVYGISNIVVNRLVTGENYFMKSHITENYKYNLSIVRTWIGKEIYFGKAYNYLSNIIDKVKG